MLNVASTAVIAFIFSEAIFAAPENIDSLTKYVLKPRDKKCGLDVGSCDEGECCSEAGFCGTSEQYCAGSQCQLDYSYACDTQYVKFLM